MKEENVCRRLLHFNPLLVPLLQPSFPHPISLTDLMAVSDGVPGHLLGHRHKQPLKSMHRHPPHSFWRRSERRTSCCCLLLMMMRAGVGVVVALAALVSAAAVECAAAEGEGRGGDGKGNGGAARKQDKPRQPHIIFFLT